MQDLLLRMLEVLDALLEDACSICFEEEHIHTPDCEIKQLLDDINEALEDPFNS